MAGHKIKNSLKTRKSAHQSGKPKRIQRLRLGAPWLFETCARHWKARDKLKMISRELRFFHGYVYHSSLMLLKGVE
jgi:hypothetical protein